MSIIVVSFNTREMTLACLRSIVEQTKTHSWEVLLLDNDSTDGSFEAIQAEFGTDPRFVLKQSKANLGFAGGNNSIAAEARGRFLLLLNPDTVVLEQALDHLVDFAIAHPENKIWGGRTVFEDGSLNLGSCWGPYTLWSVFTASYGLRAMFPRWGIFYPRLLPHWKRDTVREVASVTGCLFLIERETWKQLDGFDPEFFMYGEETDLCMRATKEVGARPIITPDATIIHHGGASENVFEDKKVRLLDSEVRLYRRHWSPMKFGIAIRMTLLGIWLRSTISSTRLFLTGSRGENMWRNIWRRRAEWASRS